MAWSRIYETDHCLMLIVGKGRRLVATKCICALHDPTTTRSLTCMVRLGSQEKQARAKDQNGIRELFALSKKSKPTTIFQQPNNGNLTRRLLKSIDSMGPDGKDRHLPLIDSV